MKNGQGDDLFVLLNGPRCFIKGLALDYQRRIHDKLSLQELVPVEFHRYLREPTFECENATFFAWSDQQYPSWQSTTNLVSHIDDGSQYLLSYLKLLP